MMTPACPPIPRTGASGRSRPRTCARACRCAPPSRRRDHGEREHVLAHGAVAHGVGSERASRPCRPGWRSRPGRAGKRAPCRAGGGSVPRRHARLHRRVEVRGRTRHDAVHLRQVHRDAAVHRDTCPSTDVPAPKAITGVACATQRETIAATSSVVPGNATPSGGGASKCDSSRSVVLAHRLRGGKPFAPAAPAATRRARAARCGGRPGFGVVHCGHVSSKIVILSARREESYPVSTPSALNRDDIRPPADTPALRTRRIPRSIQGAQQRDECESQCWEGPAGCTSPSS